MMMRKPMSALLLAAALTVPMVSTLVVAPVTAQAARTAPAKAVPGDTVVSNAEAARLVEGYFNGLTTLKADFTQKANGAAFTQEGTFMLKKPRQFVWQYTSPDRQKIIATGTQTYFVDEERNQVTQLPNNAGLARFFNTSNLTLGKIGATVDSATVRGNQLSVRLAMDGKTVGDDQAGLKQVTLNFNRSPMQLAKVDAVDTMNTATTVTFSNVQTGVSIPASTFKYTPPQYEKYGQ